VRRDRTKLSAVLLAAVVATPCLLVARRADAFFRYMTRKHLLEEITSNPDKWVDQDVTVTDELAYVFPADPTNELDQEKVQGVKCTRFDTTYFRCAIDNAKKGEYLDQIWADAAKGAKDILDKLEEINDGVRKRTKNEGDAEKERRELYKDLYAHWKAQAPLGSEKAARPMVTVFGKISRLDFYTPSFYLTKNANEEFKGKPESLTILCERVERPRQRYFDYGMDDDQD
jgi:hypothetical protein